jgi:hypothetical protein
MTPIIAPCYLAFMTTSQGADASILGLSGRSLKVFRRSGCGMELSPGTGGRLSIHHSGQQIQDIGKKTSWLE